MAKQWLVNIEDPVTGFQATVGSDGSLGVSQYQIRLLEQIVLLLTDIRTAQLMDPNASEGQYILKTGDIQ